MYPRCLSIRVRDQHGGVDMKIVTEKQCCACGEIKPLDNFHKDKSKKGGHTNTCKHCAIYRAGKWDRDNVDRSRKNHRESARRIRATKEGKQKVKESRQKNKKQRREYLVRWRKENKEKLHQQYIRAYNKRKDEIKNWFRSHPEKVRVYGKTRLAFVRGAEGKYTAKEWKDLCDKYGNICLCCKEKKPLCADHVIPVSKGGSNYISNIQPLCRPCNSRKFDKTIDYRPFM